MKASPSIFDGIEQTRVDIDGHSCTLPLFYTGGTATVGMFPASLSRLRAKSPGPDIQPAAILPGVGIVNVIAFEFETTIGPVNELCVAVPLSTPGLLPDGLAVLRGLLRGQLPAWIWHLPVSTEIADVFGRKTWSFPKIHADIPIEREGDQHRCVLAHAGKSILSLQGCVASGDHRIQMRMKNHLWQNGTLQTADHLFDLREVGISLRPGAVSVDLLSDHPIARDLDDVLLSRKSLLALRTPSLEAVLHEPERLTVSLARRLVGTPSH